jgi:hypothetical protein
MRKILLCILVLIVFSSFSIKHYAVVLPTNAMELANNAPANTIPIEKIASMKTKEAEKILGRKLILKEKIAFKIVQHKIKKDLKAREKGKPSKGQTAFILSLIGLGLLFVPYLALASIPIAIIAIIQGAKAKKEDPNDKKAKTAIILGIVTLGLFVLALIAVIIILASWGAWY